MSSTEDDSAIMQAPSTRRLPRNRKTYVLSAIGAVLILLAALLTMDVFNRNSAAPAAGELTAPGASPRTTTCTGVALTAAAAPNIPAIVAAKPEGTVFCFAPGTYRMTDQILALGKDKFIGTGATRSDVILTGAKVLGAWTAASGLYVHTGDVVSLENGGLCFSGTECQYSDWLFRAGLPMSRVLAPCSSTNVKTGVFCIDYGAKKIYVYDNPVGQTMSYSYVPEALTGGTGVVVKNLTVDKFASTAGGAAVLRAGSGWLVDNIAVQYNHGCGLAVVGTSGTVVQNSRIHDNGEIGFCGEPKGAQFLSNEVDHNNFAGFKGSYEAGGGKFSESESVTFSNNNIHDNNGNGIWFDVDSTGAVVTGNSVRSNTAKYGGGNGITYELSCNGRIQNNVVSGNGMSGIQLRDSHANTVGGTGAGNTVSNNLLFGIRIITERSGQQPRCGAVTGNNNDVKENSVTMLSGSSINGVQNYFAGTANGNVFSGNQYHMPGGNCSVLRWSWWTGSALTTVVFTGSSKSWQGTFRQDVGVGGTCGA